MCGVEIDRRNDNLHWPYRCENEVTDNMYQRSELDWLIYNAPLKYDNLILNGDPEKYLRAATLNKPFENWVSIARRSDSAGICYDYVDFSINFSFILLKNMRKYDILFLKSAIAEFDCAFA